MSPLHLTPAITHPRISRPGALAPLLLWCTLGTSPSSFAEALPPAPAKPSPAQEQMADCNKIAPEQLFHDLANFARYSAANTTLPPPLPGKRRVVFMGDSITESWATVDPKFFAADFQRSPAFSPLTELGHHLRFRGSDCREVRHRSIECWAK